MLLVVCDYFSGFIEVEHLHTTTAAAVSKALKALFARYGVPDMLVTDNGPQFASAEFVSFAKRWGFQHVTSSPHYPQSNGRAENAVKTVKRLLTKCQETRQSEFQALLDWNNTPTEGVGSSPAQRFLGRRCRTLLPMTESMLKPAYDTTTDAQALKGKRDKQSYYYDRQARDLPPIAVGETVRLRLPGKKRWTSGICTGTEGPRSYTVQVGCTVYRRNRRHLIKGGEQTHQEEPSEPSQLDDPAPNLPLTPDLPPSPPAPDPAPPNLPEPQPPSAPTQDETPQLRRSTRPRTTPDWITTYVPS